jgi:hypothetical protein
MKKLYIILALLMCLSFAKNVYADITIEILDQDTPTGIYNGEYRALLDVQITTTNGDLLQIRCPTFYIDNTFSWLNDLRFEELQWKEGDEWLAALKVDGEWDVTVPCWHITLPNQIRTITLWGKVVTSDLMDENKEFQIGWDDEEYLWLSGNPVIVNNFPQHKNIIIVANTSANNDITNVTEIRNFPNPFNPSTMISFYLASAENVKLEIFNIKGQKIKTLVDENFEPGQHQISWNGTDDSGKLISSGVYYYKFKSGQHNELTRKMILLK